MWMDRDILDQGLGHPPASLSSSWTSVSPLEKEGALLEEFRIPFALKIQSWVRLRMRGVTVSIQQRIPPFPKMLDMINDVQCVPNLPGSDRLRSALFPSQGREITGQAVGGGGGGH